MTRQLLIAFASMLAGCGAPPDSLEVGKYDRPPEPWEEGQSSKLLDDKANQKKALYQGWDAFGTPLKKIMMSENKIEVVRSDGTKLTGAQLVGVTILGQRSGFNVASGNVKFTIVDVMRTPATVDAANAVRSYPPPTHSYLYKVTWSIQNLAGYWIDQGPLCDHVPPNLWVDPNTGLDYHEYAIAFPQVWQSDGWLQYQDGQDTSTSPTASGSELEVMKAKTWKNPGGFSFACMSGAAAKCARIGYWPGRQKWGRDKYSTDRYFTEYEMSLRHEACTRAFRADYCFNNSRSYTEDGTPIEVFDFNKIKERQGPMGTPIPPADFCQKWFERFPQHDTPSARMKCEEENASKDITYEAAWSEKGPVCIHHFRLYELLPDTTCQLPDSFWNDEDDDQGYVKCGSRIQTGNTYPGDFLLFNTSDFNPLPPPQ